MGARVTSAAIVLRADVPLRSTDSTLGVSRAAVLRHAADEPPAGAPLHRLVVVGDSLSQGFQSGGIAHARLSWPCLLAERLGYDFKTPFFDAPEECPGLPFNMEAMLARLEGGSPAKLTARRLAAAVPEFVRLLRINDNYWDAGEGSRPLTQSFFHHNLSMYGWDVRDSLSCSRATLESARAGRRPRQHVHRPSIADEGQIAALRVLAGPPGAEITQMGAAQAMGAERSAAGEGIETLVVALGGNNALGSIVKLGRPVWTRDHDYTDLVAKRQYTVWQPPHFAHEYAELVEAVRAVRARRVILTTVTHVTIAPLARGVGTKPRGSRYFAYYTRPWIGDDAFDPERDPHMTGDDAWAIDSAIDDYNDTIEQAVRQARLDGLDWHLWDLSGLLDRLAYKRFLDDASARPEGFVPYELPPVLTALDPVPDTRLFVSHEGRRVQGGIIALDGVHPTTIGYGVMAQTVLDILREAGVPEAQGPGIDFGAVLKADTLMSRPPRSLDNDLRVLGWFQELVDWAERPFHR